MEVAPRASTNASNFFRRKRIVKSQLFARAHQVAAVVHRDAQAGQWALHALAQGLRAEIVPEHLEDLLHAGAPLVSAADLRQPRVDALPHRRVRPLVVGALQRAETAGAGGGQGDAGVLGNVQIPRGDGQPVVVIGVFDHRLLRAAGEPVEIDCLDSQCREDGPRCLLHVRQPARDIASPKICVPGHRLAKLLTNPVRSV